MHQSIYASGANGTENPVEPEGQVSGPVLKSEAGETTLLQPLGNLIRQVVRNGQIARVRLQGARSLTFQLAFGKRRLKRRAIGADPCAPPAQFSTKVGYQFPIGTNNKADQPRPVPTVAGEKTAPLRYMVSVSPAHSFPLFRPQTSGRAPP